MSLLSDINTVKCLLDEEELLLQLAEEAGELADAVIDYGHNRGSVADQMDVDNTYSDKVLEEIADMELVVATLLPPEEIEEIFSIMNRQENNDPVIKLYIKQLFMVSFSRACLRVAKHSMKLRRAKNGKNPTPIPAEKARTDLFESIKFAMVLSRRMTTALDGREKIVAISNEKAARWVDRLTNGIK